MSGERPEGAFMGRKAVAYFIAAQLYVYLDFSTPGSSAFILDTKSSVWQGR